MKLLFCFLSFILSTSLLSQDFSLKDAENRYDYVIITIPEYKTICESFAEHKESIKNYKVLVVKKEQILNEFDSGLTESENIRDFISYSGTYWKFPQPEYFLITGNLDQIPNFVLEKKLADRVDTIRTDYYYTQSKYDDDTLSIDFYVGRVSANHVTELQNYFNKVIDYENDNEIAGWNNNTIFIADDGVTSSGDDGKIFEHQALSLAKIHPQRNNKLIFQSDTSAYSGNKDSIVSYINNQGASSVFFIGHGNNTHFTHEDIFIINDIDLLENRDKYFVSFFMSKNEFSYSDINSITNKLITHQYGSIAAFNSVGAVYASNSYQKMSKFYEYLYYKNKLTFGEVIDSVIATSPGFQNDVFNIFGDPSLNVKYDILADNKDVVLTPGTYQLFQNYPNPFNPVTNIRFSIPESENVEIKIFNILGKEITTLVNRFFSSGYHKIEFDASDLSSGIYIYQIKSGQFMQARKMVLMK